MTQALYAHMNNKTIKIKNKRKSVMNHYPHDPRNRIIGMSHYTWLPSQFLWVKNS
jgi:hypothetical protein